MALTEKCCSVCGKINWDSQTGPSNERHAVDKDKPTVTEPCDTNGRVYVDGEVQ